MKKGDTEERVLTLAARLTVGALKRARREGNPNVIAVEACVLSELLASPPAVRDAFRSMWPALRAIRESVGQVVAPDPAVVEANLAVRLAQAAERIANNAVNEEQALEAVVASMVG